MSILIIDGHNFMHRARAGFGGGDYNIVYTFFRNLRFLVEQMAPTRVIFVLEGHPQHRYDILPEYKANRRAEPGSAKQTEMDDFHRQKELIVDLLATCFPISVIRHPHHECDDTIYNIIRNAASSTQFVVVSNDTDFIQLLQTFDNVRLYNPMKKVYVEAPTYNYVLWKSLVGDSSDNIDGFKGIGGKRAKGLLEDNKAFEKFIRDDPSRAEKFNRNHQLISFVPWNATEALDATCSHPERNWAVIHALFETWGFQSLLKEKSWTKFVATFDKLWEFGSREGSEDL